MQETDSLKKYEKNTYTMDILSKVFGAVFSAITVVMLVLGFVLSSSLSFNVFFYVAIGCACMSLLIPIPLGIISNKHKKIIALQRSYSTVLSRHPNNAVDEIWEKLGVQREVIVADFIKLSSMGFFDDIFIDEQQQIVNMGVNGEKKEEFTCSACGGKTLTAEGNANICAFCGAINEKESVNDTKDF